MLKKITGTALIAVIALAGFTGQAHADAAKPGQSMTHMKTEKGISSTLEAAGVILYVQGGATAAVMGDSISSPEGQVVFHIPVTGSKTGVQHVGSNIVLFNTANNAQVVIKNPVIDLKNGVVRAIVPQASAQAITVFTITNAKELKAKIANDKKAKLRTTAYDGAKLALAPGLAASITSLLALPEGSLPDGLAFASANVSLYSPIKK
jgi:hypothetical protein